MKDGINLCIVIGQVLEGLMMEESRKNVHPNFNFEEMKEVARILSSDFPHARIDLYNENGKILFVEITFFTFNSLLK